MKTKAAILWEPHTEWSVEDIELDPPKARRGPRQARRVGLCHSDEHMVTGDMVIDPEMRPTFGLQPVPGHRRPRGRRRGRRGRPRRHGPEPSATTSCFASSRRAGVPVVLDRPAEPVRPRRLPARRHADHRLHRPPPQQGRHGPRHMMVPRHVRAVHGRRTRPAHQDRDDIPLEQAALVGCGVTTGWGSATYAADVQSGETVAVIGVGGIGMSAVQGAAMAGAATWSPSTRVEWKREKAPTFGATHTAASMEEAHADASARSPGARWPTRRSSASGWPRATMLAPMMSLVKKAGRGVVTAVANMMADRRAAQPVRLRDAAQGARRHDLRQCQPALRHPAAARPLQGRASSSSTSWSPRPTPSTRSTRATRTCATARTSAAS